MDFVAPAIIVAGLFILLRQIERWLHQHIFKVGWLITHNFETTTILYYTFFLPGVILHEVIYWLAAGVMNVRADRSIQWPEKQDIGELNLNFIKLAPKSHPIKRAFIAASPLIVGLIIIWYIAVNIFNLSTVVEIASTGSLEDIAKSLGVLTSAPDFWLWFYLSFTIANTMFPSISKDMQGWWQVAGAIAVIMIALFVIGIGNQIVSELGLTINQILNSLSATLILTIFINVLMVAVLGAIESAIERATGHSATFKNGKMITMTREEALALREQERRKTALATTAQRKAPAVNVFTSIYAFELPIPGPPGQEPITKGVAAILGMESGEKLESGVADTIVEGTATDARQRMLKLFPDKASADEADSKDSTSEQPAARAINIRPPKRIIPADHEDIEDDEDEGEESLSRPASRQFGVQSFSGRPTPSINDEDDEDELDEDEEEEIVRPKSALLRSSNTPAIQIKDDDDLDDEDDENIVEKSPAFNRSSLFSPTKPDQSAESDEDIDADEDEIEELDSRLPSNPLVRAQSKPTPTFTRSSKIDMDEDDEDEEKIRPTGRISPSSPITAPSPKVSASKDEDDEGDEQLASRISRPNRFAAPSRTAKDDDEDEDEELSIAPRRTGLFASVNQSKPVKAATDTSDKKEEDEEDEQLARPRQPSSLFSSLNQSPPAKSVLPTRPSKNEDSDDEGEEESLTSKLASRTRPIQTSPDNKPEDVISSFFNSYKPSSTTEDDDEDEELGTSSTSSMLSGLGKPAAFNRKPTVMGQGPRPVPKPASSEDDDEDESLGGDWRSKLRKETSISYEALDDASYEDDEDYFDDDDEEVDDED